jgi:hypothetical protein
MRVEESCESCGCRVTTHIRKAMAVKTSDRSAVFVARCSLQSLGAHSQPLLGASFAAIALVIAIALPVASTPARAAATLPRVPQWLRLLPRPLALRGGALRASCESDQGDGGYASHEMLCAELEEGVKELETLFDRELGADVNTSSPAGTYGPDETWPPPDGFSDTLDGAPGPADAASSLRAAAGDPAPREERSDVSDEDDLSDEVLAAGTLLLGSNRFGQLGRIPRHSWQGAAAGDGGGAASSTHPPSARARALAGRPVKLVALGDRHTVAVVREGGTECVVSFGDNSNGQLGRPSSARGPASSPARNGSEHDSTAIQLPAALAGRTWRQVACGGAHTALLDTHGTLVLFGSNANGQLGLGVRLTSDDPCNTSDILRPICWQDQRRAAAPHETPPGPVAQVALGATHTVVLLASGRVLAFGNNEDGQLGREFRTLFGQAREDTPLHVPVATATGERVVAVACGADHSLFLLLDGSVYACGSNACGQLGVGRHPLDTDQFAQFQYSLGTQGLKNARRELEEVVLKPQPLHSNPAPETPASRILQPGTQSPKPETIEASRGGYPRPPAPISPPPRAHASPTPPSPLSPLPTGL